MKPKIPLIVLCVFMIASPSFASSKVKEVKKGNASYKKGDFGSSVKSYEEALKADPESPEVNFNLGTALYKSQAYAQAVPYLQKGLLSDDPELKKNSHFNLGNAFFNAGLGLENQNLEQAIKNLEESDRQYHTVMNLDDKDADARYNQGIVEKEIQRLKKKLQQQQSKQDKNQQQKKENSEEQKQQEGQQKEDSPSKTDPPAGLQQEEQEKESSVSQESENEDKPPFKPESETSEDKEHKEPSSYAPKSQPGEMTKEEAKALLKEFEQNEAPSEMLNFHRKKVQDRPVMKDW